MEDISQLKVMCVAREQLKVCLVYLLLLLFPLALNQPPLVPPRRPSAGTAYLPAAVLLVPPLISVRWQGNPTAALRKMATPAATAFYFAPFQFRQAKSLSSDKPSISLIAPLGISPLSLFTISKKQDRLGVSSRCSVDPNTLSEEGATEKRRELNAKNLPAPHVEELYDPCVAAKDVEVPSPARPFLSLFLGFSPSLLDKLLILID